MNLIGDTVIPYRDYIFHFIAVTVSVANMLLICMHGKTYVYFVFANTFYTKRDILFFVYNKYVEIDLHVSQ